MIVGHPNFPTHLPLLRLPRYYPMKLVRCQAFGKNLVCLLPQTFITMAIVDSGCVAQLVEQLLPIPEVHGSNPVIGKNLFILNIC